MGYDTWDDAIRVRTDEVKHIITDVVSPTLKYEGRSYPGAGQTLSVWQIKRVITSGNVIDVDFANKGLYDQVWTDRASLFSNFFQNTISLALDGVNDFLYVPHNSRIDFSNSSTFSWSCWIKTTDSGANTIIYKRDATGNSRGYSIVKTAGGEIVVTLRNGGSNLIQVTTTGAAIASGAWKNLVVTYDGTSLAAGVKVYVNGTSLALTTNSNTLSGTIANTADLYFGATNPGTSSNIAANLDEISLWSKSLSSSEVSSIYNSGSPTDLGLHSAVGNLITWLRMGDGDAYPIIKDRADQNDATMVNMTVYDLVSDAP